MIKKTHSLFILWGIITSSTMVTIQAKTESLSLDKIKSPMEIFQQHTEMVDAMNPDNGKEIKRLLNLTCEAINLEMTEYVKLNRKEKYTQSECLRRARLKRSTFCITHIIHCDTLRQLLTYHDYCIMVNIFEHIIKKYTYQHNIINYVIESHNSLWLQY